MKKKKKKKKKRKKKEAGRAPGDVERKTEEKEKRERGAPFSLIPLPVSFISLYTATTMNKACLSSKKCVASTSRLVAATQNKVRPTHTQHTHHCWWVLRDE